MMEKLWKTGPKKRKKKEKKNVVLVKLLRDAMFYEGHVRIVVHHWSVITVVSEPVYQVESLRWAYAADLELSSYDR